MSCDEARVAFEKFIRVGAIIQTARFDILRLSSWRRSERSGCGITFMRSMLDVLCTAYYVYYLPKVK